MYPNNNQQPVNPADYLNQIAPKQQSKVSNLTKQPILLAGIAAAVLIVLIAAVGIIGSLSGGIKPTERLAARLKTTEDITTNARYIKSSQLKALNSNLKLYLANTIRDITPILAAEKIKIVSLDKKVLAAESNEELSATLEDARLNGIYDRTYAREIAYRLDTILTLMIQIKNSTASQTMTEFIINAQKNLEPIQKQFSDFNAANS